MDDMSWGPCNYDARYLTQKKAAQRCILNNRDIKAIGLGLQEHLIQVWQKLQG
jgi:hypothetical protein